MQKFYFLIIIFTIVSVSFSSCKKDDGKDSTPSAIPQELVGKWHQISEKQVFYVNGKQESVYEQTTYSPTGYIQYNSDGTASFNEDGKVQMTYKISVKDGMVISTDDTGKRIEGDAKYTVTATTLNLHEDITFSEKNETGTIDYNFVKVD